MSLIDVEIGQRINSYRKELGFTQKQIADKLKISQQLIANYELGQRRIHVSLLVNLAEILHVSTDELLGIDKNKNKPGPISKIQRRLEQIKDLPPTKQKLILDFLDTILKNEHSNRS